MRVISILNNRFASFFEGESLKMTQGSIYWVIFQKFSFDDFPSKFWQFSVPQNLDLQKKSVFYWKFLLAMSFGEFLVQNFDVSFGILEKKRVYICTFRKIREFLSKNKKIDAWRLPAKSISKIFRFYKKSSKIVLHCKFLLPIISI